MNDAQMIRWFALEARLPEGKFPRLTKLGVGPLPDGTWCLNEPGEDNDIYRRAHDLTDLERLGLAVLVLRAGMRNGHATEDFATAAICERALCGGEGDRIDALLTALESAYPEVTP